MSTIVPQNALLKQAIEEVSQTLVAKGLEGQKGPAVRREISAIVEASCASHNLSPLEGNFLLNFFLKRQMAPGDSAASDQEAP